MNTDIVIAVGGTLAAAVVSLWPRLMKVIPSVPVKPAATVTYQQAMLALASVRARLVATGGVPPEAAAAIEKITHALVEGSDR